MNPVERMIAQYDALVLAQKEILQNQAVINEHLRWIVWIMAAGAVLAVIVLVLQSATLAVKTATRRDMAEMKETLAIIKQWAYSAKSHASDAQAALQDVKTATAAAVAHPTPEEKKIVEAVEKLPERAADAFIKKLDEIKRAVPPAAILTTILAGSALASTRDAVQEMREQNAAIALADWRAGNP